MNASAMKIASGNAPTMNVSTMNVPSMNAPAVKVPWTGESVLARLPDDASVRERRDGDSKRHQPLIVELRQIVALPA